MARNLSPERQAARAIKSISRLGTPRHGNRDDGKVHSLGTARQYEQTFRTASTWLIDHHEVALYHARLEQICEYLETRSIHVGQKQLNSERRALEIFYRKIRKDPEIALPRFESEISHTARSRAYSDAQIDLLDNRMTPRVALSLRLANAAGLRASELYSLRRITERSPSSHRVWSDDRFKGLESWARYTVDGKGGLVREVRIPPDLAQELESKRLAEPKIVHDRGVRIESHYNVTGGRNFSNLFSRYAHQHLGWSEGAHGLRHGYAQRRMDQLGDRGLSYTNALAIVSQELGHFRPEITEVYLR